MTTAMRNFRGTVMGYYAQNGRHDLPWRLPLPDGRFDPYRIMVSELMLQQTQVSRVIPKYHDFLSRFPAAADLAAAPLSNVLTAWQGLGYNRRAKFLWQAAQLVANELDGRFPETLGGLVALPGVGINTAGAIAAYAYDQPVSFIETNVRTVYIHHFFKDEAGISDKQLMPLIAGSLPPRPKPGDNREWYWALMDYGSHLKQTVGNLSRQSSTYKKQSAFKGSRRAVRGQVLRLLAAGPQSLPALEAAVMDDRLASVLDDLGREALISRQGDSLMLYGG